MSDAVTARWERNLLACLGRLDPDQTAPVSEHRLFIALGARWEVLPVLARLKARGLAAARASAERYDDGQVKHVWSLTRAGRVAAGLETVGPGPRLRLSPLAEQRASS